MGAHTWHVSTGCVLATADGDVPLCWRRTLASVHSPDVDPNTELPPQCTGQCIPSEGKSWCPDTLTLPREGTVLCSHRFWSVVKVTLPNHETTSRCLSFLIWTKGTMSFFQVPVITKDELGSTPRAHSAASLQY